mmetsp:Transcript_14320/g.20988  ORF Transcript_14320/g.20988 Transcript_14320/m.20988 type:complete len:567 (-) Transcript_14320:444-2144(-)|eukprot:CAMPEP_0195512118 /NCGR_PEP_ID=MMETSP0794_2-20130614/4190_1 /TAXON_ID=515487 /ORGANISM="Stephanopyxis turris, Strain CCMP 815" /LENGTH=566 /DNA_ID=CAMNT_0040639841 /DNA_START=153 /DNA_END=1853 /DNA_ORIENTATION=+
MAYSSSSALVSFMRRSRSTSSHKLSVAMVAFVTGAGVIGNAMKSSKSEELPVFTLEEISKMNGSNNTPIYMSYAGNVYDVTKFIPNHPGGSEQILLAAGGPIEPYWNLYRQHFASDLPMKHLENMIVGTLNEDDQERIDEENEMDEEHDPFMDDPERSKKLIVHNETPMNAEVPEELICESYITPNELFYLRHHHPVPTVDPETYRLKINLNAINPNLGTVSLSLSDLKSMPYTKITSTLQCGGNRRGEYNAIHKTAGTPWKQGAISTATWGGVLLRHVLMKAGFADEELAIHLGVQHVRFKSLDGFQASIDLEKAYSRYGDVLLAYEMNGEALPRDHGFPVRMIVPGYIAVRNVKWVEGIELSKEEAEGAIQRGLSYKILPLGVTDATGIDLDDIPAMQQESIFSGITKLELLQPHNHDQRDQHAASTPHETDQQQRVMVKTSGWAFAGGGRNIVRVDLTGDGGNTWTTATFTHGHDQRFHKAWAWVFWSAELPAVVDQNTGTVEVCSKAVDMAYNIQPEYCAQMWNLRGLVNNSWFRKTLKVENAHHHVHGVQQGEEGGNTAKQ